MAVFRYLELLFIALLFVAAPLLLMYGVYWIRAWFAAVESQGRMPCPHCAELIQPEARICRYCQREIGERPIGPKTPRGLFQ
jgi:hypothetical protein